MRHIFCDRLERRARARRRAAGQRAAHVAYAALDAGDRRAKHALGFLLHEECAEFERTELKPQEKTMRAPLALGSSLVGIDHLTHP